MKPNQKVIVVELSPKEAHLISILRQKDFGRFTIHKQSGEPVRIEIEESRLIEEEKGFEIGDVVVETQT
jgi:hypothetical protein